MNIKDLFKTKNKTVSKHLTKKEKTIRRNALKSRLVYCLDTTNEGGDSNGTN